MHTHTYIWLKLHDPHTCHYIYIHHAYYDEIHPQGELCRLRRDDERHERHERSVGAEKDRTQRSDDVPQWQWNLGKFGILMDFAIKFLSLFPSKILKTNVFTMETQDF